LAKTRNKYFFRSYFLGKYQEAIECYDKALEIDAKDAYAWNNKGLALGSLGKYEEALSCYDKALMINLIIFTR
jgi:tetratricopeptide (TPR) repeat protein